MTDFISTAVKSTVFGGRNFEKGNNGHVGRYAVAVGQANNALNSIVKYDKSVAKGSSSAVQALSSVAKTVKTAAKNDVAVDYACKAVKFAGDHVNPLICISSGIDVLTSDDKKSTFVKDAAGLGAMFAAEHYMHDGIDKGTTALKKIISEKGKTNKTIGNLCKKIEQSGHGGKFESIAKGLAFVVGSCTAYDVGGSFGKLLLGDQQTSKASS